MADRVIRANFCVRESDPMLSHGVIGDERVRWVDFVARADGLHVTSVPLTFLNVHVATGSRARPSRWRSELTCRRSARGQQAVG